jgi:hypothetical protein
VSSCINRRKLVPERVDRGGTLRYAWLRAPPLRHAIKIKPKPQLGCLTQEAPYEGGQIGIGGSLTTPPTGSPEAVARPRLPQIVACGFPASNVAGHISQSVFIPAARPLAARLSAGF